MKEFIRFINTVRYLKFKQIIYRIYYRFHKIQPYTKPVPNLRYMLVDWNAPSFNEPATLDGKTFTFLGETVKLDNDWNSPDYSKLWLYNLHYQDDLNAIGAEERHDLCKHLVDRWVAFNPPLIGNGWEPYCISLRVVNWVKWLSHLDPNEIKFEWIDSLASQVDALEQQIEYQILGNHLFANAKALVFAGVFFGGQQGKDWLLKGTKLLEEELMEQFLDDGGHYELSPMYHAILLWDIADLIFLEQSVDITELQQKSTLLKQRFISGLQWLQSMVHPDQDLSFFNDATLGIAPTLSNLTNYADHLLLKIPPITSATQCHVKLLATSGYALIDWPGNHRLIADVACVGPDYQPGHAHADTLSCELSLFSQRVFVNSGISQYGKDAERHRQRSTAAHNTLLVDCTNSSEVWAGFRVARRAKPNGISVKQLEDSCILKAYHDGYYRLPGGVIHHRQWLAKALSLSITDELTGRYNEAVVYWHIHPEIEIVLLDNTSLELILPQGQIVRIYISGANVEVHEGVWHPQFGQSVVNSKLVLKLSGYLLKTKIEWNSN